MCRCRSRTGADTSTNTITATQESEKLSVGGGERAKGWTPPPHGATGKSRIYIRADSQDWPLYAEDFRQAHGEYPKPNEHGGKWFKIAGEQAGT